jgi:hypothetical protein
MNKFVTLQIKSNDDKVYMNLIENDEVKNFVVENFVV